jgi:hypothetical protein
MLSLNSREGPQSSTKGSAEEWSDLEVKYKANTSSVLRVHVANP